MPIEPSAQQLAELAARAGGDADGPVVMVNLNRYRDRAAYETDPPGGGSADVGGREAYARYGEVAMAVPARVGGRILWHGLADRLVIGDEGERFDEVIVVWYPSRTAFLELATAPEILTARADRAAALERATLISCEAGAEPVLEAG
jgi:uncharacterized protein (DUF1330 family)